MGLLTDLTGCRELARSGSGVDDKGLESLQSLSRLRELSLDSTGITDKSAPLLTSMSSLKTLNLYHTFVTEKGMQELKGGLPTCAIVFDRDSALPTRRSMR